MKANQAKDNLGGFQGRNSAAVSYISKVSHRLSSNSKRTATIMTAGVLAVFSWVTIAGQHRFSSEAPDQNASAAPSSSNDVPDPIAPAAAFDSTYQSAPPSGQASDTNTSVEVKDGEAKVFVNGQQVDLPNSGTVTQTTSGPNGGQTTTSVTSSQNGSSTNSSSVNVNSTFTNSNSTVMSNSQSSVFQTGGGQ